MALCSMSLCIHHCFNVIIIFVVTLVKSIYKLSSISGWCVLIMISRGAFIFHPFMHDIIGSWCFLISGDVLINYLLNVSMYDLMSCKQVYMSPLTMMNYRRRKMANNTAELHNSINMHTSSSHSFFLHLR